jgi:hypothetical protein
MTRPRDPIFNWPIVICLIILGAFGWAFRSALYGILNTYGELPFAIVCIGGIALLIAAAFVYDRFQARHSHQSQPPKPTVRLPPEM